MLKRLRQLATMIGFFAPTAHAYPALDMVLENGIELHLVGSIHMGTADMAPLPKALIDRLNQADTLIVEADISTGSNHLDAPELTVPIKERLSETLYQKLQARSKELGIETESFDSAAYWYIALMLQSQQAARLGLKPDYGIDYQLLQHAHIQQKQIIELEGVDEQYRLLKNLPDDGFSLLEDTLEHWSVNARLLQKMLSSWIEPSTQSHLAELPDTFSPELFELLLNQRNQRWNKQLRELPPGKYVVAVGAMHLYGKNNLVDLLKAESVFSSPDKQ